MYVSRADRLWTKRGMDGKTGGERSIHLAGRSAIRDGRAYICMYVHLHVTDVLPPSQRNARGLRTDGAGARQDAAPVAPGIKLRAWLPRGRNNGRER